MANKNTASAPKKRHKKTTLAESTLNGTDDAGTPSGAESGASEAGTARETGGIKIQGNADTGEKPVRLGFNQCADGSIDWDNMKEKKRAALLEVLKADPFLRAEIAGAAVGGDIDMEHFDVSVTEADAKMLLRGLNGINKSVTGLIMERIKKFPIHPQILDQSFKIPPEQESEMAVRAARIANRRLPAFLKKYMDEILLIGAYAAVVQHQTKLAVAMQTARNQRVADAAEEGKKTVPNGRPAVAVDAFNQPEGHA